MHSFKSPQAQRQNDLCRAFHKAVRHPHYQTSLHTSPLDKQTQDPFHPVRGWFTLTPGGTRSPYPSNRQGLTICHILQETYQGEFIFRCPIYYKILTICHLPFQRIQELLKSWGNTSFCLFNDLLNKLKYSMGFLANTRTTHTRFIFIYWQYVNK